jgi:RimJ/RimL family protein N-acetyltransferase
MAKANEYLIRKAKKGDGKRWVEMWNEGIKRKFFVYNGNNKLRTKKDIAKANKKYSSKSKNEFTFFAVDKKSGKIIGSCFSNQEKGRTRHRVEFGWMVHPDYSNKGIATSLVKRAIKEAKKRGIKRAEAEAAKENIASIKLAKRCGFKIEGTRKKGLLTDDGRYIDTYLFGQVL